MSRLRSKGTAALQEISSVYTAIAQVKSIKIAGEKSETTDGSSLDQSGAHKLKDPTGFVEPCTITLEVHYDPALASHVAFEGKVAAPVATNFKITYTDSAPTSEIYSGVGFGIDKNINPSENVNATLTIETSGAPS